MGYRGAGTVEFLYHPKERTFAFLEVNTRLQVEHSITELTTDVDLVKAQIHVAAGGRLEGDQPLESGHAVEARLNAEDPDRDFAPAPGRIALLELPAGPGIRVDTGVSEGDTIPADFDSMIAKIIAYGRTRNEALARLRRALAETAVIIEGGATNKSFVLDLLAQPELIDGSADTGWIDRVRTQGRLYSHRHAGVALVAAGIEAYEEEEQVERQRLLETAHGGRPQARHEVGRAIDLKLRGVVHRVTVARIGPHRFRVGVGADGRVQTVDAVLERLDAYAGRLVIADQRFRLLTATHGPVLLVEVDGVTHRVSRDEGGVMRSPAPALVVATPVEVGAEVEAGAPVMVLESMKMETVLQAPFAARVRELLVSSGSQVETGTALVRLEPRGDVEAAAPEEAPETAADLELPAQGDASAYDRAVRGLDDLRSLLLGFDLDPRDEGRTLSGYVAARAELTAAGLRPVAAETDVLRVFADLSELSRNRPAGEDTDSDDRVHSPREHFHTYLQSLDVDRGGLPETFRSRLGRVLAHYGVTELDTTPELQEAVFRIFLAQQRTASDVVVVTTLLQQWVADEAPEPGLADEVREVLDRLVLATQLRFPVVGDLARSIRFRWYDQPLVEAERGGRARGRARASCPTWPRARTCPTTPPASTPSRRSPSRSCASSRQRLEQGIPEREPMLETLARRHYREHELHDLRTLTVGRRPFVVCDYTLDDRPTHLVTTLGTLDELADPQARDGLVESVTAQVEAAPEGHESVVDLYLAWPEAPQSPDEASARLAELLVSVPFAKRVRRVAIAVCPGGDRPVSYFSFRPGPDGVVEDDLVRGVHPMVGRRLNLWRLRNFRITRLDAPEDVLLYHCVAEDNEADQRLVALAQIRQFAIVRDQDGEVVSLPHAERAVASCLEAIRRARTSPELNGAQLDMNHVWLHIWPVVDAQLSELTRRCSAPSRR